MAVTVLNPYSRWERPDDLIVILTDSDPTDPTAIDITGLDVQATWKLRGSSVDPATFACSLTTDGSDGSVTVPWADANPSPFDNVGTVELEVWASDGSNRYASERVRFRVRPPIAGAVPPILGSATGATGRWVYQGEWDADTNDPTLASGEGTLGDLYLVSTGGTTTLDDVSTWAEDDLAWFDGTEWRKISGADSTAALAAHEADTTSVHGISDTSVLETTSGAQTKANAAQAAAEATAASALTTHEADTTTHGISAFGASLVDDADAATARATLDVDQAGTDNSTDVTLAGTPDYITISGQTITRNPVDLAADVTGDLPTANIADCAATLAKLANLAQDRIIGRVSSGAGVPEALTPAQVRDFTGLLGTAVLADLTRDGSADAASGLNALLSAGGTIVVPPGLYRLDAQLVIPAGTTLWLLPGAVMRRNWGGTAGDKQGNATIRNENAVWSELAVDPGPYSISTWDDNITIIGGTWEATADTNIGAAFLLTACRDLVVSDVTVDRTYEDWAFVFGGEGIAAHGLRLLSNTAVMEDGVHIVHGSDISVHAHEINSGDDMVAVGSGRNMAISRVRVQVDKGRATRGHAAAVLQDRDGTTAAFGDPTETIADVEIVLGDVRAGLNRNGLVDIRGDVADLISDVTVRAASTAGTDTHDGTNPFAVRVDKAVGVSFHIDRIRNPRRSVFEITDSDVSIAGLDAEAPSVSGTLPAVDADNSTVRISQSVLRRGTFHVVSADNGSVMRLTDVDLLDVPNTNAGVLTDNGSSVSGSNVRIVRASGATSSQGIRTNSTSDKVAITNLDVTDVDRTLQLSAVPAVLQLVGPVGAAKTNRIITGGLTVQDPETLVLVRTGNTTDTLTTISGGYAGRRIRMRNGEADPATNHITLNNSGGTGQIKSSRTWRLDTAAKYVDLEFDGTSWMVIGSGGFRTAAFAPTNDVTDRAFNANATTLEELADVVATMIKDQGF